MPHEFRDTTAPDDLGPATKQPFRTSPSGPGVVIEWRHDAEGVRRLLASLPDWFGIDEATAHYVRAAAEKPSCLAVDATGRAVGVALIERHFAASAELYLIAVDPTLHARGIGRRLVAAVEERLRADGVRLLQVKTVGAGFAHEGYARTRAFYRALGFVPVEEFDELDWDGPTLLSVKVLDD